MEKHGQNAQNCPKNAQYFEKSLDMAKICQEHSKLHQNAQYFQKSFNRAKTGQKRSKLPQKRSTLPQKRSIFPKIAQNYFLCHNVAII